MRTKIYYRTTNLWNILLFTSISLVYFLIQESAYSSISMLDKQFLTQAVLKQPYVFILYSLTSLSIYFLKPISKYLFFVYIAVQLLLILLNLSSDFSKLIVVTSGVQIVFSYYFYNFLVGELKSAAYNSNTSKKDLFENSWREVVAFVGNTQLGYLSNWDENGFNIVWNSDLRPKTIKEISLRFENKEFKTEVNCAWISSEGSVGFLVRSELDKSFHDFNWSDLYCILLDMGFKTGYIR